MSSCICIFFFVLSADRSCFQIQLFLKLQTSMSSPQSVSASPSHSRDEYESDSDECAPEKKVQSPSNAKKRRREDCGSGGDMHSPAKKNKLVQDVVPGLKLDPIGPLDQSLVPLDDQENMGVVLQCLAGLHKCTGLSIFDVGEPDVLWKTDEKGFQRGEFAPRKGCNASGIVIPPMDLNEVQSAEEMIEQAVGDLDKGSLSVVARLNEYMVRFLCRLVRNGLLQLCGGFVLTADTVDSLKLRFPNRDFVVGEWYNPSISADKLEFYSRIQGNTVAERIDYVLREMVSPGADGQQIAPMFFGTITTVVLRIAIFGKIGCRPGRVTLPEDLPEDIVSEAVKKYTGICSHLKKRSFAISERLCAPDMRVFSGDSCLPFFLPRKTRISGFLQPRFTIYQGTLRMRLKVQAAVLIPKGDMDAPDDVVGDEWKGSVGKFK